MKLTQSTLIVALFVALAAAVNLPALAAASASTNAPAKERVLVIVETSTAMQKRAENTQKALGSVISSGLKGQIESGCTIGLWTFNETLFAGQLPLQLWTPPTRQRVALALVQALQQQKNEKAGRLAVAWAAATNIVAQSERITVLLFSAGNESLMGTPFDAEIGESFSKNAEQQRKSNMPFLTILRAVNGKFVAFAVNMPPWPLEIPEWPDGYKPAPAPAEPKVEPIAVTLPPNVTRPDPSVLSPTNTIYLVESAPSVDVPSPKPAPANPIVIVPALPAAPPTNAPAGGAPLEAKPRPGGAAMSEPKRVASEPVAALKPKLPIVTILVAGICVLLGVMVVFIALLRWSRRSAGESLITRSMHRDDR